MASHILLLLSLMGWSAVFIPTADTQPPKLRDIVAEYDSLEKQSITLDAWTKHTNENGSVAWNTSYLLESYVAMYQVTSDQTYLDRFVVLADPLMQSTDEKTGAKDYRGRTLVGWGSSGYYGRPERIVWLVHTGMIVCPLLRFAETVKQDAKLGRYAGRAKKYQQVSESALAEFDSLWRFDPKTGDGYYIFDSEQPLGPTAAGEDLAQPLNMQFAAGRAFIFAWKLTGNEVYRQKAAAMAALLKHNLTKDAAGVYQWTYWFGRGLSRSKQPEDLSHGAIDIGFAVMSEENDIVFTQADLTPFVNRFFQELKALDSRRANTNAAASAQLKGDRDSISLWIALSENSCRVYDALAPDLMSRSDRQDARVLLAISKLAQYTPKCSK